MGVLGSVSAMDGAIAAYMDVFTAVPKTPISHSVRPAPTVNTQRPTQVNAQTRSARPAPTLEHAAPDPRRRQSAARPAPPLSADEQYRQSRNVNGVKSVSVSK